MTDREILIGLFFSLISGTGVWIIQLIYSNRKNKQKEEKSKIITFHNEDRVVDETIFVALSPGTNVELMRSVLGTPNKIFREDDPISISVFSDSHEYSTETNKTNSYLYTFKNASVKVTSVDDEKVDSLTVMAYDDSLSFATLEIPEFECGMDGRFWQTKVSEEMIDNSRIDFIRTRSDFSFVLSHTVAASIYKTFTFWT